MRTPLECYAIAARCAELARIISDDVDRRMLMGLSEQWKKLGETADEHAARIARSYDQPR